jgi:GTP-binding protein
VESELPFALVLTKRDKLSKRQQEARLEELKTEIPYAGQITLLPFSSETGEGLENIIEIIEDVVKD